MPDWPITGNAKGVGSSAIMSHRSPFRDRAIEVDQQQSRSTVLPDTADEDEDYRPSDNDYVQRQKRTTRRSAKTKGKQRARESPAHDSESGDHADELEAESSDGAKVGLPNSSSSTNVRQKSIKGYRRPAQGTGHYHSNPCNLCAKTNEQCKVEVGSSTCVKCYKWKAKCKYAHVKGGIKRPGQGIATRARPIRKSQQYIIVSDEESLAPRQTLAPKTSYVEVTHDGEAESGSGMEPAGESMARNRESKCKLYIPFIK